EYSAADEEVEDGWGFGESGVLDVVTQPALLRNEGLEVRLVRFRIHVPLYGVSRDAESPAYGFKDSIRACMHWEVSKPVNDPCVAGGGLVRPNPLQSLQQQSDLLG